MPSSRQTYLPDQETKLEVIRKNVFVVDGNVVSHENHTKYEIHLKKHQIANGQGVNGTTHGDDMLQRTRGSQPCSASKCHA